MTSRFQASLFAGPSAGSSFRADSRRRMRMPVQRSLPGRLLVGLCLASLLAGVMPAYATEPTASVDGQRTCETPGNDGCLPTPTDCATGNYNGAWRGAYAGREAVCAGGAGHIAKYVGGDANLPCGAIIVADVLVTGSWKDPNRCPRTDHRGEQGGPGSMFQPPVETQRGVVSSSSAQASEIGIEVLDAGGNAVDAAVATAFAVGVARPELAGLGGSGSMLYRSNTGEVASLWFELAAPAAIQQDTFIDKNPLGGRGVLPPWTGRTYVGVPGVVAGLSAAMERYGTLSWQDVIRPAEDLARRGPIVTTGFADSYADQTFRCVDASGPLTPAEATGLFPLCSPLQNVTQAQQDRFALFPETARTYLKDDVRPPAPGELLPQPDLADTLATLATEGPDAFYEGSIADKLIAEMERPTVLQGDDALITAEDLASYEARWLEPIVGNYRGNKIITMPAPSAGGIMTQEILNILQGFDVSSMSHSSADHLHVMAESLKLAWADAYAYVTDPRFYDVPQDTLVSPAFAAMRRAEIDMSQAKAYLPGAIAGYEDPPAIDKTARESSTAHISVIDAEGNAASLTFSVGVHFGSAIVADGTGFVLNSMLDDWDAGTPNIAAPGKNPQSTMSPTILVHGNDPVFVGGAAGGDHIPMTVIQAIINVVDFGMDVGEAVDAARFTELVCCTMGLEDYRVPSDVLGDLRNRGHVIDSYGEYAGVYSGFAPRAQLVAEDFVTGIRSAASDPRDETGAGAQ